jgi:uncharacterized protein
MLLNPYDPKVKNKMGNTKWFALAMIVFLAFKTAGADEFLDRGQIAYQAKNYKRAFDSYRASAERGNAEAMGNLALLYEKGQGCEKNAIQALKWLKSGARKGDAPSQNNLGYRYFKGLGVKQNSQEALKWFQKAANQELASAQGNMGLMYGKGLGVSKDCAKALEWFKKAAQQDDLDSQVNLAMMLSLGEGAPKDYVESYKWFLLALKHDLPDGRLAELRDNVEWLEKRMTGKQIAEAKKRADGWNAKYAFSQIGFFPGPQ